MIYEVVLTKRASSDLKRLDRYTQKRIVEKLQFFANNPLNYADKLKDFEIGKYRFRIGTYRAVFDLDGSKVVVLRIGHRREIYR